MRYKKPSYPFYACFPTEVEVSGEHALCVSDRHDYILTKSEYQEMLNYLNRFYESEGVEKWIDKTNRIRRWVVGPMDTTMVDGKYVLPEPVIKEKVFRKDLQKHWSRTCDWCGHRFYSKDGGSYYILGESISRYKSINGSCCSKACAENLWFDKIVEWIKEEGLTDIFHTDKRIQL